MIRWVKHVEDTCASFSNDRCYARKAPKGCTTLGEFSSVISQARVAAFNWCPSFFSCFCLGPKIYGQLARRRGGRAGKADTVGFFERDSQRGFSFLAPTKPPTPRSTFFIPDHLVRSSRPRPRCVSDNSSFLSLSFSIAICSRDWPKKRWSRWQLGVRPCGWFSFIMIFLDIFAWNSWIFSSSPLFDFTV